MSKSYTQEAHQEAVPVVSTRGNLCSGRARADGLPAAPSEGGRQPLGLV